MTRIAFIGLGNMGGGMAIRQVVGGREVHAFDLSEVAVKKVVSAGAYEGGSIAKAVEGADLNREATKKNEVARQSMFRESKRVRTDREWRRARSGAQSLGGLLPHA